MKIFTLFVFLACQFTSNSGQVCNFPSSLWCSSREIAQRCQVEQQCILSKWNGTSPVNLTVYIESLCPDCKDFIKDQLWPTWNKVKNIMNLDLVPYGNAREVFNKTTSLWNFFCQHGTDECVGNMIETCAIHELKNAEIFFPFIHCIEASEDLPQISAPNCAKEVNISYTSINFCASNQTDMGNKLEHEMALRTDALNPPHSYVPWVTLNGVHTEDIQHKAETDLLSLICDTYQGPKPKACSRNSRKRKCVKKIP